MLEKFFNLKENNTNRKTEISGRYYHFYDHGIYFGCKP